MRLRFLGLALFLLLLSGCEGVAVATPPPTTITVAGATSLRPALNALAAAFSRQHSDVLFDLRGGGSTLGEEQARIGQVHVGASTLLPSVDEAGAPRDDGLQRWLIGLDGLAMVVHRTNDVAGLSLLQLRDLYAGEVLDWVQVGGQEGEILLVSREEGSGARATFEARVMGDAPVSLTAVVMPTSADVVEYIAHTPQAIGYVSRAYVRELLDEDAENDGDLGVRILAVEGQLPTRENLAQQSYFLVQPLYLVTPTRPEGKLRQFLDFVLSSAGQEIVAQYHAPVR